MQTQTRRKVIDFSAYADELFNEVFYDIQEAQDRRFLFVWGGASASKSYSAHQFELMEHLDSDFDTLVLRKNGTDIKESTYKLFCHLLDEYGVSSAYQKRFSNDERSLTNLDTGKRIVFKGCDDADKLKSSFAFKRILVEEADQLTWEDFTQLMMRFRGIEGIRYTFIFNPVSEEHWLKKRVFDSEFYQTRSRFVHSTYKKNLQFLTKDDVDILEGYAEVDFNFYQVYTLGQWGSLKPDAPYFHAYDPNKHVKAVGYDDKLPVYLSFDFNVRNSAIVGQIDQDERRAWFLEEIRMQGDGGDLRAIVRAIVGTYGPEAFYFITGDASGNNRSALTTSNLAAYELMEAYFREEGAYDLEFRVPPANPRTEQAKVVCNAVLVHADVAVHPKMTELHTDLMTARVKSDGSLDKADAEKRGVMHVGDCARYFWFNFCYDWRLPRAA